MPLSDTGLLVRYYFDEAASGTTPTTVEDSSSNNYDLTTINYGSGNLAYTEVSGNRGLVSSSTTGTQRASRAIDNTSDAVRDALAGANKVTIELVINLTAFNASGGRIFGLSDRAGGNGIFMVRGTATNTWQLTMYNTTTASSQDLYETWNGGSGARAVFHVVWDSTLATTDDRVKVYKDGSEITSSVSNGCEQNATLVLPSDIDLIAFNREASGSFDRSVQATLFYAAIYNAAFDATRASDHYNVLTADDDTPSASTAKPHYYYAQL